jgi:hypothetical protein
MKDHTILCMQRGCRAPEFKACDVCNDHTHVLKMHGYHPVSPECQVSGNLSVEWATCSTEQRCSGKTRVTCA